MLTRLALIAFHCATIAASPAPAIVQELEARDDVPQLPSTDPPAHGWCTFHQHLDWSNGLQANPNSKLTMDPIFDANGKNFTIFPQQEIQDMDWPITIPMPGLGDDLLITSYTDGQDPVFTFEFNQATFMSNDTAHCSTGKSADPFSKGNNNRWSKDYDCGFTC